jgi:hypothetical protein
MYRAVGEMLVVYGEALRRHRLHIANECDKRAWHEHARFLINRAVASATRGEDTAIGSPDRSSDAPFIWWPDR